MKVFVVDSQPILRFGFSQLVNNQENMICVGEAQDAENALRSIVNAKPDIVVVDIFLPGISGLELCKRLLDEYDDLSVLMTSDYHEACYVDRVLHLGARGYLAKQEKCKDFLIALQHMIEGKIYVSAKSKDAIINRMTRKKNSAHFPSPEDLSNRELEVLYLIGQGYTNQEIASRLYLSIKTVESHNAHIKEKLNLQHAHALIQYAVKWILLDQKVLQQTVSFL